MFQDLVRWSSEPDFAFTASNIFVIKQPAVLRVNKISLSGNARHQIINFFLEFCRVL